MVSAAQKQAEARNRRRDVERLQRLRNMLEESRRLDDPPADGIGKDIKYEHLWPTQKSEMDEACCKQLEAHISMGSRTVATDDGGIPKGDVAPSRMLPMYKHKIAGLIVSERCNARGQLGRGRRRERDMAFGVGRNMLLLVAMTQPWRLQLFDVAAAFMQGEELPADRALCRRPPSRLSNGAINRARSLFSNGYATDLVCIQKGVFGLVESPRLGDQRVRGPT